MRYYSLNNSSPLSSFKKAVQNGIAPDRGLYFPEKITPISEDFINNISDYSNEEIGVISSGKYNPLSGAIPF